ncbi:ABC transporter permease [Herbiconiux daphne]|uniref:ABC transporter permease n=1 Tax=Herbiconiux daphne TaxID=2970914 RepID=A0ABT2H720_9MICO|nr:ABC transporter permease [Herbiconiux daphne]MCS5735726.1 ABC transporter permease [Herbiconiux daphne]
MLVFLGRRILSGAILLVVISALTFTLIFSTGGNIARTLLGDYATDGQVALKAQELGLDRPLVEQLVNWFTHAVTGDFGRSWFTSEPVTQAIMGRLPVTLSIVFLVMTISVVLSVTLGLLAATKRGLVDRATQGLAIFGAAVPGFIVAIVLVTTLALQARIFPATGFVPFGQDPAAWALSLFLPVAALVVGTVAASAQQIRSSIIDVLRRDYVRTLRSRGLGEREILLKHVLRSASPPGLTVLALQFVGLLGGTVIVEQVFSLPGIGFLAVQSTTRGDLPVVLGVVVFTVIMVILINLAIDVLVGWLNPKARIS